MLYLTITPSVQIGLNTTHVINEISNVINLFFHPDYCWETGEYFLVARGKWHLFIRIQKV